MFSFDIKHDWYIETNLKELSLRYNKDFYDFEIYSYNKNKNSRFFFIE